MAMVFVTYRYFLKREHSVYFPEQMQCHTTPYLVVLCLLRAIVYLSMFEAGCFAAPPFEKLPAAVFVVSGFEAMSASYRICHVGGTTAKHARWHFLLCHPQSCSWAIGAPFRQKLKKVPPSDPSP